MQYFGRFGSVFFLEVGSFRMDIAFVSHKLYRAKTSPFKYYSHHYRSLQFSPQPPILFGDQFTPFNFPSPIFSVPNSLPLIFAPPLISVPNSLPLIFAGEAKFYGSKV